MTTVQPRTLVSGPKTVKFISTSAASTASTASHSVIQPSRVSPSTGALSVRAHRADGALADVDIPQRPQHKSRKYALNQRRSPLPSTNSSTNASSQHQKQPCKRKEPTKKTASSDLPYSVTARPSKVAIVTYPPSGRNEALLLLLQDRGPRLGAQSGSERPLLDADRESAATRQGVSEKELESATADARQQLGQPNYVAIAARQRAAEQKWNKSHDYERLVQNLHEELGVLTPAQRSADEKNKLLSSTVALIAAVTDKTIALQRAEMAYMVSRLRRRLSEANIKDVPIIPAAPGIASPSCQHCIELASEVDIEENLIAVLRALVSERVLVPMAGRCGAESVMSTSLSGCAMTLNSLSVHRSRANKKAMEQQTEFIAAGAESGLPVTPARFWAPRCFRVELVPLALHRVSIHVTVHASLSDHFFEAHARRRQRLLSPASDPQFSREAAKWTDAHQQQLLHCVLNDLLHGGANPAIPAAVSTITLFPVHVDAIREALWCSAWSTRTLMDLFTISEEAVASYLGEEVIIYFAWMNHYARWLLGASLLGVLASILSSLRLAPHTTVATRFVKDVQPARSAQAHAPALSLTMEVRCTVQHYLDLALLPLFSTSMILGSLLCIKMWERRSHMLCMRYYLFHQGKKDEPQHSLHDTPEAHRPRGNLHRAHPGWYGAFTTQPLSWGTVAVFLSGTLGLMVCSLNLDGMVSDPASRLAIPCLQRLAVDGGPLDKTVHPRLAVLPRLGYSVCISVLSHTFAKLAKYLTCVENHRYCGEHIRALTLKRAVFEFVNAYTKLFFILFGRRSMSELSSNLQSIFCVRVLSQTMSDTVIPFLITHRYRVAHYLLRRSRGGDGASLSRWPTSLFTQSVPIGAQGGNWDLLRNEMDEMLDPSEIYMDFIDTLIQFGYILFFSAAYPVASLVALLSNITVVRSNLFKMCYVMRRPVPRLGVQQNLTWCILMRCFPVVAVMTNTYLLALRYRQVEP